MKTFNIYHYGLEEAEETYLSSDIPRGSTGFAVKNNRGFDADDYFIIGTVGAEKTEQLQTSLTTGDTTITSTAACKFAHNSDDPITRAKYNQVQIYRATTGAYSLLETVDIEWDQRFTSYADATGTSSHYYKWKFYNETSTAATDYSHIVPGVGFGRKSVNVMTNNVLKEGGDEKEEITDRIEVLSWFGHAQDDIASRLNEKFGYDFLKEDTNLSTSAATEEISLPSDFDKMCHINYAYDDGTTDQTYKLRQISLSEFEYLTQDDDADTSDELQKFCIDEDSDTIRLYPTPTSASLVLGFHYFKDIPELDDDADETLIPIPRILEAFALEKLYRKRGTDFDRRADRYKAEYETGVQNLIQRYKRRTGPKGLYLFKHIPERERRYYKY